MYNLCAVVAIFLMAYGAIGADLAIPKKPSGEMKVGLIVTIDQQQLSADAGTIQSQLTRLRQLLFFVNGELPKVISRLLDGIEKMGCERMDLVATWDQARANWIEENMVGHYHQLYIVKGAEARDKKHMRGVWQQAIRENQLVDYVSMVHGGGQFLPDDHGVPDGRLRMVYSEACRGGSGKSYFVDKLGAMVSAGHNEAQGAISASPFFSFRFLKAWAEGESFTGALNKAWNEGKSLLSDPKVFPIAGLMGKYKDPGQAIDGSRIQYAWRGDIQPSAINIYTKSIHGQGEVLHEGCIDIQ